MNIATKFRIEDISLATIGRSQTIITGQKIAYRSSKEPALTEIVNLDGSSEQISRTVKPPFIKCL